MQDDDSSIGAARDDTLVRLAESRAEIRRLLEPPPRPHPGPGAANEGDGYGEADGGGDGVFPRSRTMKLLLSGRGLGTVAAVVGGLLIARPALGLRLLRMLPVGALSRMLLVKGIAALTSRRN
jgi:hypothetical protein